MGFFETLRRVLSGEQTLPEVRYVEPTSSAGPDFDPGVSPDVATTPGPDVYDRMQWQKKLKRILDELPATQGEWPDLMTEARALSFDPEWIRQRQVEEFQFQVRRAVADRHFTEDEHRKLDLARDLIGLPEAEAETLLHAIVAEAEAFFGEPIEDS